MDALPERRENQCQYPGCNGQRDIDLCPEHSTRWGRIRASQRDANLLPNDGIFDWTAVDAAVRGLRIVRLSWVEREVAAIIMYLKGLRPKDIEGRLGCEWSSERWEKIRAIAEAFNG